MLMRNIFTVTQTHEILKAVCDGFFVAGILVTAFGLLVIASNGGTFDMLKYGVYTLFALFLRNPAKRKYRTFYDYRLAVQDKKRGFGYMLIVGGAFLVIAGILLIVYLQYEPQEETTTRALSLFFAAMQR